MKSFLILAFGWLTGTTGTASGASVLVNNPSFETTALSKFGFSPGDFVTGYIPSWASNFTPGVGFLWPTPNELTPTDQLQVVLPRETRWRKSYRQC